MCILFVYQNLNPSKDKYRLILIANRDEYYARPAKSAHYWKEYPGCLGGFDMEPGREGGTWLALNVKTGRIGVILNLNGTPKSIEGRGRGFLIREYITSLDSIETYANYLHKVNQDTQCYNPYNLVMVDIRNNSIHCVSSVKDHPGPVTISEEISGIGNGGFEHPYKKVLVGKNKFEDIVNNTSSNNEKDLIENLLQLLKLEERHLPDKELEKRSPEAYNELSSIFVRHEKEKYGTRTHSIILVDQQYHVTFIEETLQSDGVWERQTFKNNLD